MPEKLKFMFGSTSKSGMLVAGYYPDRGVQGIDEDGDDFYIDDSDIHDFAKWLGEVSRYIKEKEQ